MSVKRKTVTKLTAEKLTLEVGDEAEAIEPTRLRTLAFSLEPGGEPMTPEETVSKGTPQPKQSQPKKRPLKESRKAPAKPSPSKSK